MRGLKVKGEFDESLDVDDYYFQLGGLKCYIVRQKGWEFYACENKIKKTDEFLEFFAVHNSGGWDVVADIVVADTKEEAIKKIKRINKACAWVAVICLINMFSIIFNSVAVYNFVMLGGAFLSYKFISIVLSSMRTELLKDLISTQTMVA
ncbi:hypothetical protein [Aeromonas jandaei]|uniref:hypothetical protein n=1 Tax=Aeromonas jandaei TaxID=650 RepID=UPI003BA2D6E0